MSSLARVAFLVAVAGCTTAKPRPETIPSPSTELTEAERIAHVLSRLTFGARPGDAERVAAMGVGRWIDEQLHPEWIVDSAVTIALRPIPSWSQPTTNVAALTSVKPTPLPATAVTGFATIAARDSGLRATMAKINALRVFLVTTPADQLAAGKIIRAQLSERQLLEVISDFWENHFSVYSAKMPSREALIVFDRDVIRPHAFGKFRDLLGAVAHSPAMLFYLDNQLSRSGGLNENYARELMELHTLGVDGGYTQHDVIEVARALTGWTIAQGPTSTFTFQAGRHDTAAKTVLGHTLKAGRGAEDGEDVLDILAHHPSTAHYIAFKLARRLVSDDPPPALVKRAAATFARTDGDIAAVVRTIVTSPEFFSRSAFRAKVKTPFELVVSARRALGAAPDTTIQTSRRISQLGQAEFGYQTPEGWPEKGDAWMNSGAIYNRIKFAGDVVDGRVASMSLESWRDWQPFCARPAVAQVEGVITDLLGGSVSPATRRVLDDAASNENAGSMQRLKELVSIALSSPEFQRR